MSIRTKSRIMGALVTALALWPLCHYFIVAAWDLNPWNWFGWAMYSQPAERIEAVAFSVDGAQVSPTTVDHETYREIQKQYLDWSRRWVAVDARDEPEAFARAILRAYSDWEGVHVRVDRIGLDRESATIEVFETRKYLYFRRSLGLE